MSKSQSNRRGPVGRRTAPKLAVKEDEVIEATKDFRPADLEEKSTSDFRGETLGTKTPAEPHLKESPPTDPRFVIPDHYAKYHGYREFVGMPVVFEETGKHQFDILVEHGMLPHHTLLDLGGGGLSLGRHALKYLDHGNYWILEANPWLIEAAKRDDVGSLPEERGMHLIVVGKQGEWDLSQVAHRTFDYIMAHSIFTHTGPELVVDIMRQTKAVMLPGSVFLATFYNPYCGDNIKPGWIYPGGVSYTDGFIRKCAEQAGFKVTVWRDPRHPIGHSWAEMTL